jgi:hypothetical protein
MSDENLEELKVKNIDDEFSEELEESGDYPFKSWETFSYALTEKLNTEFYSKEYPEYAKILKRKDDYYIVRQMYKTYNLNAEHGLTEYIMALCYTGTRYACEHYDLNIIDFLISKGAKFPTHMLFGRNYDIDDLVEECYGYDIRAYIIDEFAEELNMNVYEYAEWDILEPEHIDDQEIDKDKLGSDSYCDNVRFKHLKFLSSYLQNVKND